MNRPRGLPKALLSSAAACLGIVLLLALLGTPAADAQDDAAPEVVIFVLDLSGSMNEPFDDDRTKLEAAKAAFVEAFANVSPDALVGLRTYGDQIAPTSPANREASCTTDTRLRTPVGPLQRQSLISEVEGMSALGDTPMGLALEAAASDIPAGARGTIVLFSDGRDECFDADLDGDPATGPSFGEEPCAIARSLLGGATGVDRVVTVGFATDAAAESELRCIADATAGAYTAIETAADARDVLPDLLVELSAPREAERLEGRSIAGTEDFDTAPDMQDLGTVGATQILYTDTIEMNSERIYRVPEYQPGGGTLTATVFGLPPEPGLTFDLRMYSPRLDQEFFEGDHGDSDAGLPERSSASIRCTGCALGDRTNEVFWIVSLSSEERGLKGSYELELLTEGPGFGGPVTSCRAPQACFYRAEIESTRSEIETLRAEIAAAGDDQASESLIAERDAIQAEADASQSAVDNATRRTDELEARIAVAPEPTTSWRLPMFLILLGAILAFAPLHKLLPSKGGDDEDSEEDGDGLAQESAEDEPAVVEASGAIALGGAESSATLSTAGEAPAVSENRAGAHDWDAELEAAKAALAQQRPVHPREDEVEPLPQRKPAANIAAENAAIAAAALAEAPDGDPEASELSAALETVAPAVAPAQAAPAGTATSALALPAASTDDNQAQAAEQAAEQAAQQAAEQAAAEQAAAQQAAEQAAAQQQGSAQQLPAGWYADPAGEDNYRWWDGSGWTSHTNSGEGA